MNLLKKLTGILLISLSFNLYAQVENRDVPYTKSLMKFIDCYFDHKISSRDFAVQLYNDSVASCPDSYDEYQKETHLSRCDYYFGMYIIEMYDLTELEHALDDTSKEYVDPVEYNRKIKAEAAVYFDAAIVHCLKAMKIRPENSPDAMSIYAQALSANCTVHNIGYVLSNGLKIGQFAKKAAKADPKNATAWYSVSAQDVFAPGIFGNAVRGRKKMLEYYSDETLIKERFDVFNFSSAIGYTYYRQNKYAEAREWYCKCQKIYPDNYAIKNLIKRIDTILAGK
ncbi:hypothetical protein [Treponema sp.]|uniref:hypothetical protein n=1 Tax=Treponema sp. TaxID=166 RepID=UPI00298DA57C|nr:hypothetical protein [Treponema sp.]MCR5614516.1 hypothetical protein [Treponema sp.]